MSEIATGTVAFSAAYGTQILAKVEVQVALVVGLVLLIAVLMYLRYRGGRFLVFDKIKLNAPFGLGSVEIRPVLEVRQVAHEAWVELATRKAALPFDPDHDTIAEVYDSWYSLFGETRNLVKRIPAVSLSTNSDSEKLIKLLVGVLNVGIRPHLTRWQARFRRWYDEESKDRPREAPQVIQQDYPDYAKLEAEIIEVSKGLAVFAEQLKQIALKGK